MTKYILLVLLLAGCATPMTTLQNPKTGQVIQCGGNYGGSILGGAIGYHIQKDNDEQCANQYRQKGFK